ncbi:uncharacterized protein N7511_006712 [Penicillium nucicola]|uniref:uncharacterized protein n=1 Tax=Penicillium nucicola TaxID=1850975 RepID=UPI002544FC4B|nr:uncharacterized protein N7511_006712 [Penicillium nucicola]KAJ5758018.1 hypothetical protein N7511_006712 [Penicillium nucicola]
MSKSTQLSLAHRNNLQTEQLVQQPFSHAIPDLTFIMVKLTKNPPIPNPPKPAPPPREAGDKPNKLWKPRPPNHAPEAPKE